MGSQPVATGLPWKLWQPSALPYSSLLPPYFSSTSGSTLLFSNTNVNKRSSPASSGNEVAQSFTHQCHLWIVSSNLGLLLPKQSSVSEASHWGPTEHRKPSTPEHSKPFPSWVQQTLPLLKQLPPPLVSRHCPLQSRLPTRTHGNDVLLPSTNFWTASLLSLESGLKSFIPSLQLYIINKMYFLHHFFPVQPVHISAFKSLPIYIFFQTAHKKPWLILGQRLIQSILLSNSLLPTASFRPVTYSQA